MTCAIGVTLAMVGATSAVNSPIRPAVGSDIAAVIGCSAMSDRPTEGTDATTSGTRPAGDVVTLVSPPSKMGLTPADGRYPDWRAMLFFGASAKGFHCLPTLQRTKNISHDEI